MSVKIREMPQQTDSRLIAQNQETLAKWSRLNQPKPAASNRMGHMYSALVNQSTALQCL